MIVKELPRTMGELNHQLLYDDLKQALKELEQQLQQAHRAGWEQAMQGQLASLQTEVSIMMFSEALEERGLNPKYPERLIAINSVNYAKALLEEVKRHETQA